MSKHFNRRPASHTGAGTVVALSLAAWFTWSTLWMSLFIVVGATN
jgi:hypothetical protein